MFSESIQSTHFQWFCSRKKNSNIESCAIREWKKPSINFWLNWFMRLNLCCRKSKLAPFLPTQNYRSKQKVVTFTWKLTMIRLCHTSKGKWCCRCNFQKILLSFFFLVFFPPPPNGETRKKTPTTQTASAKSISFRFFAACNGTCDNRLSSHFFTTAAAAAVIFVDCFRCRCWNMKNDSINRAHESR